MTSLNPSHLSVAFVWHMHQPYYKNALTGEYLMPWVRLHAIKDYLDMVVLLKEYPKIKATINLVPSLIEQLRDYESPETHDPQSHVTVSPQFGPEDKKYLLHRGFDAPFHTKIAMSPHYTELYQRLKHVQAQGHDWHTWAQSFSDQDFADITALHNLVWMDPHWLEGIDEIRALWSKQSGYTLAERQRLIQLERDIIHNIIPAYKLLQNDEKRIEITTTPYYHPILPLLINTQSARESMPFAKLPHENFNHPEDAQWHLSEAAKLYRDCFDAAPRGLWPSEQSVSPEVLTMAAENEFQWLISDEGIMARSTGHHLSRDSQGNLLHPELLCKPYHYNGVNLIFRHLALSDLIGFHYMNMPAQQAADDLYWRIKDVQSKCHNAKLNYPLLTIALDGENCWEQYHDDGVPFLKALYGKLSSDDTLNVCRVSDYFDAIPANTIQPLERLHSGSWINSDFHIWIGDPVKNAAWDLLKKTRDDLVSYLAAHPEISEDATQKAWREIYIAEGSDWFWWYGEPNHSGQDDLFDEQFRLHLGNVYRILGTDIPKILTTPLAQFMGAPAAKPKGPLPLLDLSESIPHEEVCNLDFWADAGQYDLSHGAMYKATRIIHRVHYGSNSQYAMLQFELNPAGMHEHHQLALYFCTPGKTRHNSPMRYRLMGGGGGHTTESAILDSQTYLYAYECIIDHLSQPGAHPPRLRWSEALPHFLWQRRPDLKTLSCRDENKLTLFIPFDSLGIRDHDHLEFSFALASEGDIDEFHPERQLLQLVRYPATIIQTDTTTRPNVLPEPATH